MRRMAILNMARVWYPAKQLAGIYMLNNLTSSSRLAEYMNL